MKKIKATLKKSPIDKIHRHKLTLKALGLTRIGKSRVYTDSPALRGMLNQVSYMLLIEESADTTLEAKPKARKGKGDHEAK
jgi:large subunit ribosomal protein L30